MCGRDGPSSLGLLNLTWVWAIGFCLCLVVCWLQLLCGVLLGACFCPFGRYLWLLVTSLMDVFGSSLSGSGMVALVFATGLPVWRLWARLVFLPLVPVCPDVEGFRLPPLPPHVSLL